MVTHDLTITDAQAALLANLSRAREQAEREVSLVLTAICAGHGIGDVSQFSLTGTALTVTLPDPPAP
jgi:hypothetical protein